MLTQVLEGGWECNEGADGGRAPHGLGEELLSLSASAPND